ncbi:DUF4129 domain-containing protein [Nocardioides sp. zg-1230]|uniref:DUF4129 domain-containing protein n=1 Tax=Nocardioides sp. zg-1230 TaxID=2736601 RepID=UPI0015523EE2|nr:DUF4129 domain-containing protein [Nocardioides sp. zg-1230]NPC42760.1 DUF4129 domain-containing protein [Nocardioides sp. zg-1230]
MRAFGNWPPGLRAVAAVAGACLLMVLVAWATLIGPDEVFTGPGPRQATTTTETCAPRPPVADDAGSPSGDDPNDVVERFYCKDPVEASDDGQEVVERPPPVWMSVIIWILLGAMVAGVAALVLWLLAAVLREVRARRIRPEERDEIAFAVLDEPVRVAEQVAADAEEQDTLLREGDPRNGIVAAWHRFEVQGERAGVGRRVSETSSEYALRILDLADADAGPVNRLAELYREARFSDHAVTEAHRSEALAALAAIRHSLGART